MKYTIKDLSEGKCAVINDGTLEELRKVLKLAFPEDSVKPNGTYEIYRANLDKKSIWASSITTNLPTQSVKDFLEEWVPKYGEEVEVSINGKDWKKRIFVAKNPRKNSFITITLKDSLVGGYSYIRQVNPVTELSMQEIADKFNIPVDQLKIKK